METMKRGPVQGVTNIIRFNWPFYFLGLLIILFLGAYGMNMFPMFPAKPDVMIGIQLLILPIIISLLLSWYIYDISDLYTLNWFPLPNPGKVVVNINAGFDETSELIHELYQDSQLKVFDFYDPKTHTEASIKRARRAYPPYKGTVSISTSHIPLEKESVDTVCLIFAAHEIRKDEERIMFFKELDRILKPDGKIVIAEHLRDAPNFFAYTIGFFHFLSMSAWTNTFSNSGFRISYHKKHTPFVNIFILEKNGNTL